MTSNRESDTAHAAADFRSQMWLFGSVLLGSLLVLLALEWAKTWAGSGVEAYIRANQLWTQAQKEAVIHLTRYAETGDTSAYRRYQRAIRVPLAYRDARAALQDSTLDWERARNALLTGGSRPQEVSDMIRLIRYLGYTQGMQYNLSLWKEGDALIDSVRSEAGTIRAAWKSSPPDQAGIEASIDRIVALDVRLSGGERLFREILHNWADWLRGTLFKVQIFFALLSLGIGFVFAVRTYRRNRRWKTELEESEERYRKALMSLAEGLVVHDRDGAIQDCNPSAERILGLSSDQILGRTSTDPRWQAIREDGAPFPGEAHPAMVTLRTGEPQSEVTMGISHPDGHRTWVSINTEPMYDEKGDLVGVVASFTDITEQRQLEADLREAKEEAERTNRMKDALLSNTSHEIRTPLTSILGFTDAIRDRIADLEDQVDESSLRSVHRFINLIERSGRRLKRTLGMVLDLSKLEAGEKQLSRRRIDVGRYVEEIVELIGREAEEHAVDLHTSTDERPIDAIADPEGLRIALRNLVFNAVKYTRKGGDVWIRARERDAGPVLEVEDNGIGMDPDRVPELFEPFRQESEGGEREYQGAGLGLTVTQKVIQKMGGSIKIETEKGDGTCVTVWLSAEEEDEEGDDG